MYSMSWLLKLYAGRSILPALVFPDVSEEPFAENNGVKAGAADGLVLHEGTAVHGNELSVSEMMGVEEEEPACDEGNDECMQRRLLRDAHLDYIYTQHKGKP
uniref:Phytosulfokine n=1 Tax=Setaria viridis TaxID=4556 RepID=A0A4U6TXR7_SETVI|nr:hypothetical protein SEVIR_7G330500v2 [Setaria viridis]